MQEQSCSRHFHALSIVLPHIEQVGFIYFPTDPQVWPAILLPAFTFQLDHQVE